MNKQKGFFLKIVLVILFTAACKSKLKISILNVRKIIKRRMQNT